MKTSSMEDAFFLRTRAQYGVIGDLLYDTYYRTVNCELQYMFTNKFKKS